MNKSLENLKEANPSIEISQEEDSFILNKLWGDQTFFFRYPTTTNFKNLEDIELPQELAAILHKKEKKIEFIFSPLASNHKFLKRKTTFFIKGIEFKTEFAESSKTLKLLAEGFIELDAPSDSQYRNLNVFRDYYNQDQQSEQIKEYFADKKPISFFVQGDFKKLKYEYLSICKHINIYLRFFDRRTPIIAILESESKGERYALPCISKENDFPTSIVVNQINPIALDLLHIANETGTFRLKYIFYFQVLEYFSYYYLEEDLKRKLNNILKSPDLLHNSNIYTRTIIEELKDYSINTGDKQKLVKLVSDYIDIDDILLELRCNIKTFTTDIEFEGGFKLQSIIQDEKILEKLGSDQKEKKKEKEKLKLELLNAISDRLDKLRNVLVHVRESRENKVILPTKVNNRKLLPYIYLIRRIAENISFRYEL